MIDKPSQGNTIPIIGLTGWSWSLNLSFENWDCIFISKGIFSKNKIKCSFDF
jgi:hypothetical protein